MADNDKNTQGESSDLDDFIDTSMEGTADDFLGGDDDTTDTSDDSAGREGGEESPASGSAADDGPEPREPSDPDNPNNFQRVGSVFADGKGNIVDRAGRVLAAKGEAARHWMNMSRQLGQAQNLARQNQALSAQVGQNQQLLEQARQISELPQKYGMSREEFNDGMELLANWQRDPVGVAREVVSRTLAMGHNVTDILGKSAGDALEMRAVRQLIDEATRGQRQQEAEQGRLTQHQQAAQNAYHQFIARYPDAELHSGPIAELMNNHGRTAVEAYHEVRLFCSKYNLDFNEPLGPQIEAVRAQQQRESMNGRRSTTQRAPMSPGASGGRGTLTDQTQYADADSDWSSILNSVLRDS